MTAFSDPFFMQLSREWLMQYSRFIRRRPDVVKRLSERTDEFELVPVPCLLLNELAQTAPDSTTDWTHWLAPVAQEKKRSKTSSDQYDGLQNIQQLG